MTALSKQKVALEELRYGMRDEDCSMEDYIKRLQQSVSALESKQNAIKTAKDNNEYLEVLKKYQIHKEEYEKFCINLVMEIEKLNNILNSATHIVRNKFKILSNNILPSILPCQKIHLT